MIVTPITITLAGTPKPAGSMKCIGKRGRVQHQLVQDFRPGQAKWRKAIARAVRDHVQQRAEPLEAIGVDVTLTLPRPQVHYRTGRFAALLRADAPVFPTRHNTGDRDKLLRLVSDALQDSGVLIDDAQIIDGRTAKCYPGCPYTNDALDYPGAVIRIYAMTAEPDQLTLDESAQEALL